MNTRTLRPVRLCVAALAAVAVLLSAAQALAALPERITVTDLAGREVAVPALPQRIVCLGPGCLRLIVYLQAQDRVVGIESLEQRYPTGRPYYMAHPELGRLPTVTPGGTTGINAKPDMEGVLSARPEVVFATYMDAPVANQIQRLLGTPVVVLAYGPLGNFDPAKVKASLLLAGRILGREQRTRAVVGFLENTLEDLAQRAARSETPPRTYVGGLGFKGAHGLTSTDTAYLPFVWLGMPNLVQAQGPDTHVFLGKERLLALDPEVIFIDGGGLELVARDYTHRPAFYQGLAAFRSGRVYGLHPFNWYTTNLGTALADAYAIGAITHPAGFAGVDPAAKANQIYSFLVGAPVHEAMVERYGPLGGPPGFLKGAQP